MILYLSQFITLTAISVLMSSCAPNGLSQPLKESSIDSSLDHGVYPIGTIPDQASNPTNPTSTLPTISGMLPLAWESKVKNSAQWSDYVYSVIQNEEPQMLADNAALDADLFCPRYKFLTPQQKLNFWGQLFAGITKFESGWKPNSYYIETTMGIDPITGKQVASEGLLQLSYQDSRNYGRSVCDFNWSLDKNLSSTDINKTILNPYKNLRCGIKIMAKLLKRKQMISFESGVYWAVLRKNGNRNKVSQIADITKSLRFCISEN